MIIITISKKELSTLVQQLSEQDIPLVVDLLERLIKNPLDSHIPYDDEPLTEEDIKDIKTAKKEFTEGLTIKLKDIEHELRN